MTGTIDIAEIIHEKQKNSDLRHYDDRNPLPKDEGMRMKMHDAAEEGVGVFIRGEYRIKRVPQAAALYEVERVDGKPVPAELQGNFTSVRFIEKLIRGLAQS